MGIFSHWFRATEKRSSGEAFPELRCRDLAHKQTPAASFWRQAQKGKTIHKVPALSFEEVVEHFAPEISSYVGVLPLEETVIDNVVMPVIRNLILHLHLLPASEAHHHSGIGGLLVHSLQTARVAVQLADQMAPPQEMTPQMRYRFRHLVPVAVSLGMLLHDCGKTNDMAVVAENGDEWMPDAKPLTLWLDAHEHYFVYWRPDREHKRHELASMRFAYSRLLTQEALNYLVENRAMTLFDAVAEAVLLGSGCFAALCKSAEQRSIEDEKIEKRNACVAGVQVSVPLVALILRSIKALIANGEWQINSQEGPIFMTSEGVFLVVNEKTGQQIRTAAMREEGAEQVPGTTESILRILEDSGVIAVGAEDREDGFWQVNPREEAAKGFPCVKFLGDIQVLVPDGMLPKMLEARSEQSVVTILSDEKKDKSLTSDRLPKMLEPKEQQTNQKDTTLNKTFDLMSLRAPKGRFLAENKEQISEEVAKKLPGEQKLLSREELLNCTDVRLDRQTCMQFCQRLMRTAAAQLLQGEGELVVDGVRTSGKWLTASSNEFEKVLERQQIDIFSFQTICQMFKDDCGFVFDESARVIRIAKPAGHPWSSNG